MVHKAYLGRTADLTPERLATTAINLAGLAGGAPRATADPDARAGIAASEPPNNLPVHLPRLIGREAEVAGLRTSLLEAERGLLTLVGTGGSGKTRLALEVAATVLSQVGGGAWLVELASIGDPDLVPKAVASALGLPEVAGRPVIDTVRGFLRHRSVLLVLDNCEHLVEACARLTDDLLTSCPGLGILATSREPLRITGEVVWRVAGLSAPDVASSPRERSDLDGYAAVRLFVERARAVRSDFSLAPANAGAVAEICGRLGGLPLALELAAARVRVLAAEEIAAHLHDSIRLLTGGSRTSPTRQQTLRATLDWSHDLLSAEERILFQRLSVFVGDVSRSAIEVVCVGGRVERTYVLDLLTRLVDKSLVLAEARDGLARYRLLESVRQYAHERLVESGEWPATEGRHAAYFLALAEEAEPALRGPEQDAWLDRLEAEHDNLLAALRSARRANDRQTGLRLGAALADFWWLRGHFATGRARLEGLISGPEADGPPRVRARALLGLGMLEYRTGDHAAARAHLNASIGLARSDGDLSIVAEALAHLGRMAVDADDLGTAGDLLGESLAIARSLGDRVGIARGLGHLGTLAMFAGDQRLARERLRESQGLARALGDRFWLAVTHLWLSYAALELADASAAGLELGRLQEAIDLRRHRWLVPWALHAYARLALLLGRPVSAARLEGAAEAHHDLLAAPVPAVLRRQLAAGLHRPAQRSLTQAVWQAGLADGRTLDEASALAYLLDTIQAALPHPREGPERGRATEVLTRREREVARLVAQGLTDREIATALTVGRRTAESHVAHCLAKLGLASRARLAAWAVEVGLTGTEPTGDAVPSSGGDRAGVRVEPAKDR